MWTAVTAVGSSAKAHGSSSARGWGSSDSTRPASGPTEGRVRARSQQNRSASRRSSLGRLDGNRGPGPGHGGQDVGGQSPPPPAVRARSKASWAPRWATRAKSAGVKPAVRAATSAGSPAGRNSAASSAAFGLVGCTHRDDQVEPTRPQERLVDGGDGVGGHDHEAVGAGLEHRHDLQELVDQRLAVGTVGPVRGDLVGLVDEAHQTVHPARARPALSRRARAPSTPCPSSEGWSSTKAQDSREAMARAKEVFPVPGGPKRSTAAGGTRPSWSASSVWASGATTRRSRSPLAVENPFIDSHRPVGRHVAPEPLDDGQLLGHHRGVPGVEVQPVEAGESLVGEGRLADLARVIRASSRRPRGG